MKKGATLTSGIFTILLFTILLFVSIFEVANIFKITFIQEIFENYAELNFIITIISSLILSVPLFLLRTFKVEITELYNQILVITFAVFSLFMIIWGIKEILISKKEDASFAKCKKTCGFMMFTKFMFFVAIATSLILYFVSKEYKVEFDIIFALVKLATGVDYTLYFIIGMAALTLYALIIFLLPTINFAVAYKHAKRDGILDADNSNNEYNSDAQTYNGGEQFYTPQSTMQANMPPIPGYQPQYNTQPQPQQVVQPQPEPQPVQPEPVAQPQQASQPVEQPKVVAQPEPQPEFQPVQPVVQQQVNNIQPQPTNTQPSNNVVAQQQPVAQQPQAPATPKPIFATSEPQPSIQAQFNPQVQAEEALRASSITPGQNGVPLNITQKGIEGLERLERLRAGGMLTEENYQAMRQKIFTTDIA